MRFSTSLGPNKNKSRVVILSDSHLKGCTKRVNSYLSEKFRTFGCIKPGALAEEILDRLTVDLENLKNRDVIVISAGANNVYRNNPNEALIKIIKFIQNNGLPLWSSGQSFWLQIRRPGFDSRHYQKKKRVVGLERGPLSLVSTTEELLDRKVAAPV
jgi:hypothetical protein